MWEAFQTLGILGFSAVLGGGVGFAIGRTRNRESLGLLLGLLLGPLGWLIIAVMPADKPESEYPLIKCPACLGEIPAIASKCRHCGTALFEEKESPAPPQRAYYLKRDDKTEGPFTLEQMSDLLRARSISAETLCTREGDQRWIPVGNILVNRS